MANYRKILRTGAIVSGLLLTGSAVVPAMAQTRIETSTDRDNKGFPWGLLGLIGLAGLVGRKQERPVVHAGRV